MKFISTLPEHFLSLDNISLKKFLQEITCSSKLLAFARKAKDLQKSRSRMQLLEEGHGLEVLILTIFRPEIAYNIYRKLEKHKLNPEYNLEFGTSEFLTFSKGVYQQAPTESSRKSIRGYYNSCFDNPQGMNPFAHEMFTAQSFHRQGLVVEFVDLCQKESTFEFKFWRMIYIYLLTVSQLDVM